MLRGDESYSATAHRENRRARGVKVVISKKGDQQANCKNKGCRGGEPVGFGSQSALAPGTTRTAASSNELSTHSRSGPGLATRNDKHALPYSGGMVLGSIVLWLAA